jgi:hypothetical protein
MKNNLSQLWLKGLLLESKKVKFNIFPTKKTNLFLLLASFLLKKQSFFCKTCNIPFFSSFSNAHTTFAKLMICFLMQYMNFFPNQKVSNLNYAYRLGYCKHLFKEWIICQIVIGLIRHGLCKRT